MDDWDLIRLFLQIGILVVSAKVLGDLAKRVGLPSLVGEVMAGVVLGPGVLGNLAPGIHSALFSDTDQTMKMLSGVVAIAAPLFLFAAGAEINLGLVRREWRVALVISAGGVAVPLLAGFLPTWCFPAFFDKANNANTFVFSLFCASAMSITALPMTIKLLQDLGVVHTLFGASIIAAAVFDDLTGWLLFALVVGLDRLHDSANATLWPIATMAVATIGYVLFMLTIGRAIANKALPYINARPDAPVFAAGILGALAMFGSATTQFIGIHSLFGAFIAGVAFAGSPQCTESTRENLERFVRSFLAPLFFATLSLGIDFFSNFDLLLVLAVLLVATVGKTAGCGLAARCLGWSWRESTALGFAMNSRGGIEIIMATVALREEIIGPKLFVALVIMAIGSSAASSMIVCRLMSPVLTESSGGGVPDGKPVT